MTKRKDRVPKRVEHGNGRGRGRGSIAGAPRGRSEFRGRGRGRGASTNTNGAGRRAVDTTSSSNDTSDQVDTKADAVPASAADDAPVSTNWTEDVKDDSAPAWAAAQDDSAPAWDTAKDDSTPAWTAEESSATITNRGNLTSQSNANGSSVSASKPKSRMVDKNSTSSWASIAKPPVVYKPPPPVQESAIQTPLPDSSKAAPDSRGQKHLAPLTEKNLETVTENQAFVPEPPTATLASLQGEPATGPSSLHGSVAQSVGPPGLKSGPLPSSVQNAGRSGTPVGGRRLNQDEAVVMPGSEREPTSRLGVQFGSLGLGDDDDSGGRADGNISIQQNNLHQHSSRQEKGTEIYSYGAYGAPQQQSHQQQGAFSGPAQEQYTSMSGFYGQNDQARQSPFAHQPDYYQQTQQGVASQRPDPAARQDQSTRFGEANNAIGQVQHANTSPISGHPSGHHHQQQHSQFPMHPQYAAPNPYAYYGYGYGYPHQQQQHGQPQQHHQSGYSPMYGQQRGGYGAQGQYGGGPLSQVGTSQDRFERSTAEYQRQQQVGQYSHSSFGQPDFLGSSRNQHSTAEAGDQFKNYNSHSSVGSREDGKNAPAGHGGHASGFSQGMPTYGEQQQQPQQSQAQGQYSQYGSYGRTGGHQQYGGQQWGQY